MAVGGGGEGERRPGKSIRNSGRKERDMSPDETASCAVRVGDESRVASVARGDVCGALVGERCASARSAAKLVNLRTHG